MVVITQQRERCIGCNYCAELASDRWAMSKRDGKATLIGAVQRKGFHTVRVADDELEANRAAAQVCPVKVIRVSTV